MAKGRMINKDISDSKGFAALSAEAATLFCILIPHFNSFGKMNGDPHFVKGEICPRIEYLTLDKIIISLKQIAKNTNVKWFEANGRFWLHSTTWQDHQILEKGKLGEDKLPSYTSGRRVVDEWSTSGRPQLELQDQDQVEDQDQGEGEDHGQKQVLTDSFSRFFEKFPKKVHKKEASRIWNTLAPSPELLLTILEAVDSQIENNWAGQPKEFIPGPDVWLRNKRWEDEIFKRETGFQDLNKRRNARIADRSEFTGGICNL